MGPALPAIGAFIAAIFVGTASANLYYVLAVNLARIGALALIAKLTAPKLSMSDVALRKTVTIRDPVAPQKFVYGEDLVSGPIIFSNTSGIDNKDLNIVIALTGHEIDSVVSYRIDNNDVPLSDLSGAEDGTFDTGFYAGTGRVDIRHGTLTQVVIDDLVTSFTSPTLFTSAHTGRGWSLMNWKFQIVKDLEDVYRNQPQNIRALVRGYKVYDPRLDSSPGNSPTNPSFITWSDNPALCLAHFITDDKFGMKEEDDRIDWDDVVTAADICDATVSIPGGSQARYTCNVTFESTMVRSAVRDELLGAMMGRMVFSQGVWKMWAGAAVTADVTLTEANLLGAITLETGTGSRNRYNRVRGKHVDAAKDYVVGTYPEARSSTYVIEDGGEVLPIIADFTSANNFFEAQRKSIITLKQSRNQRVVVFQGNYSCFRVQTGSVVDITIEEYGFAGEKFFVTEWKLTPEGVELTLVEEVDAVWSDPLVGDYATRTATGVLIFTDTGVPPVTLATITALSQGIRLDWTNPIAGTFHHVEVWRGIENIRDNALLHDTTVSDIYIDIQTEQSTAYYYWLRVVNDAGQFSVYTPDLTTTTLTAVALPPSAGLNPDPDFDLSTDIPERSIIFPRDDDYYDTHWTMKTDDTGATPTRVTTIVLVSGGVGGSNSCLIKMGDGSTRSVAVLNTTKRIRSNDGRFRIIFRYRTNSGSVGWGDDALGIGCSVTIRGFDLDTHGAQKGFTTAAESNNVFFPASNTYVIKTITSTGSSSTPEAARFWEFQISNDDTTQALQEIEFDSIFIYPIDEEFVGADGVDDGKIGLVKPPAALDNTKFLKGDGTWDDPLAGGTLAFGDLSDVDLTGAIDNDMLYRSSGQWLDTAGRLTWDGGNFRIWDFGLTDYLEMGHDQTDFNFIFGNTTDWNITGLTQTNLDGILNVELSAIMPTIRFNAGNASSSASFLSVWDHAAVLQWGMQITVTDDLDIVDFSSTDAVLHFDQGVYIGVMVGRSFRVYDSLDIGYMDSYHTGSNFTYEYNTVADVQFVNATVGYKFDNSIYIQEQATANADSLGWGQFWVRDDAPNIPMFTDDTGLDWLLLAPGGNLPSSTVETAALRANNAGGWIEETRIRFGSGGTLEVWDTGATDNVKWDHDGIDLNQRHVNTAEYNVFDGVGVKVWDSGDGRWIALANDGQRGILSTGGTGTNELWIETDEASDIEVRSGAHFLFKDAGNTDWMEIWHGGTDFNMDFTNTTDLNITGLTRNITLPTGLALAWGTVGLIDGDDFQIKLDGATRELRLTSATDGVEFQIGTDADPDKYLLVTQASFNYNSNEIWHAGNDGPGSGLDADTIDGIAGSNIMIFAGATVPDIGDMDDVAITAIATNDILYYNGSGWVNEGYAIALGVSTVTQVEAEAGTAVFNRWWTAERVGQAIAALGGGGGDVSATGSPVNDELAVWTNSTTIEGEIDLTFGGQYLMVGRTAGTQEVGFQAQENSGGVRLSISTIGTGLIRQLSGAGATQDTWIGLTRNGAVGLWHNGTEMAQTNTIGNGGFHVNNTVTGGGFERVLTTSDIGGSGDMLLGTVQSITAAKEFNDNVELRFGSSADVTMEWDTVDMEIRKGTGPWDWNFRDGCNLRVWDTADAAYLEISAGPSNGAIEVISGDALILRHGSEVFIEMNANAETALFWNGVSGGEIRTQDHNGTDNITGGQVKHFDGTYYDMGMAVMPRINVGSSTTMSDQYWHKRVVSTTAGSINLTFNTEASQPNGVVMWVQAEDGPIVLVDGSMVLHFFDGGGGAPPTGNINIARGGWATIVKDGDSSAFVTGVGLT